jgi:hypothetical protein
MKQKTQIDLERLRHEIQNMTYDSSIYKVLKEELSKKDYWKARKRGKPNMMFTRK